MIRKAQSSCRLPQQIIRIHEKRPQVSPISKATDNFYLYSLTKGVQGLRRQGHRYILHHSDPQTHRSTAPTEVPEEANTRSEENESLNPTILSESPS
jgi:hypothetical protein